MTLQKLAKLTLANEIFAWVHVGVDMVIIDVFHDTYVIFEIRNDKVYVIINGIDPSKPGVHVRRYNIVEKMNRYLKRELPKAKDGKPPYDLREGDGVK